MKVIYIPNQEKGIVKSVVDADFVFVVYSCNNDWENYKNYTGVKTATKDLKLGWS